MSPVEGVRVPRFFPFFAQFRRVLQLSCLAAFRLAKIEASDFTVIYFSPQGVYIYKIFIYLFLIRKELAPWYSGPIYCLQDVLGSRVFYTGLSGPGCCPGPLLSHR